MKEQNSELGATRGDKNPAVQSLPSYTSPFILTSRPQMQIGKRERERERKRQQWERLKPLSPLGEYEGRKWRSRCCGLTGVRRRSERVQVEGAGECASTDGQREEKGRSESPESGWSSD